MIYIVEVPHQRPASCWVAHSEAEFCRIMVETYHRRDDTPADWDSFSDWCDYLADDLHTLHVYTSDADALAALDSPSFNHHQGAQARAALEAWLQVCGVPA